MGDVEDGREAIAGYGQWSEEETARLQRHSRLLALIRALLTAEGAGPVLRDEDLGTGRWAVDFDAAGRDYRMCSALLLRPSDRLAAMRYPETLYRHRGPRPTVLLAWSPPGSPCVGSEVARHFALAAIDGVVLGRDHMEAALAGFVSLTDLVQRAFRRGAPWTPLLDLVRDDVPDDELLRLVPASRLDRPVRPEAVTYGGVSVDVALAGPAQALHPSGLAVDAAGRLVVTGDRGLMTVDPRDGRAGWRLAVPGCAGAPLCREDGSVLVVNGETVLEDGPRGLRVLAGHLGVNPRLFAGNDGEPWVVSGSGVTFGQGDGTLALTRVGNRLGQQQRYDVEFPADVRSAGWLAYRRFFLAGTGSGAVVDLGRSTSAGLPEEWLEASGSPERLLRLDADSVLTASPDGSGTRLTLFRTAPTARTTERLADLRLGKVLGLAEDGAGRAHLLATVPGNDHPLITPVVVTLTGHRSALAAPSCPAVEPGYADPEPPYLAVAQVQRGQRVDYECDEEPMRIAGQAQIFRGVHEATGVEVALKSRLAETGADGRRRMRREVEIARRLGDHPHIMPVLDAGITFDWFVMPLATASAEERRTELREPSALREFVEAIASALAAAHAEGWLHRDIKPSNVLLLDGRWRLADWGIVRRPRGETTGVLTGDTLGTSGFAAPELSVDPHNATPASDIYGLGQLIGWVLTDGWPRANVPQLPPGGPWFGVVRSATQMDPAARPRSVREFLDLVAEYLDTTPDPVLLAVAAAREAAEGDEAAALRLLALAADHPTDSELYLDVLAVLPIEKLYTALLAIPERSRAVAEAFGLLALGPKGFGQAERAIDWLFDLVWLADKAEDWLLLDAAVRAMFRWDGWHGEGPQQLAICEWLQGLDGPAADIVAPALRQYRNCASRYTVLVDDRRVHTAIRSSLKAAG